MLHLVSKSISVIHFLSLILLIILLTQHTFVHARFVSLATLTIRHSLTLSFLTQN